MMKRFTLYTPLFCLFLLFAAPVFAQDDTTRLWLDVKDVEIRDVISMISKAHSLNIILDKGIEGKVTLHLSDAPVMEGLEVLAKANGLVVLKEGSVYRIAKKGAETRSKLSFYKGNLTADIIDMDVNEFIDRFYSKTGISIISGTRVNDKISAKLNGVPYEEALKALFEGNGYKIYKRKNIYHVVKNDANARNRQRGQGGADTYVDYSNGLVSIEISNGKLDEVIKDIAKQSGVEIINYVELQGNVDATFMNVPVQEAFALLLGGTKYSYVYEENIVRIGQRNPNTESGRVLTKSELYHLHHIKADEIFTIVPRDIDARNVKVVKEQNALLISGSSEEIVKIRQFLNKIDIPTPQVIIDAIVVEYNREVSKDIGLEIGTEATSTDPKTPAGATRFSYPYLDYYKRGADARELIKDVLGLSNTIVGELSDQFFINLRLMQSEGKAKVLAQPSLTVLNGNKAAIDVGYTEYFKVVGGTSDNPTYTFQPISFGIKLDITPWISSGGQITTEVRPEIANAMGRSEEGYPNVFKRAITTTVRLEDGETLILGGLLRTEEEISDKRVPLLSRIPVIGKIFTTFTKSTVETNLVVYITPRIINKVGMVDIRKELENFEDYTKKGGSAFFKNQEVFFNSLAEDTTSQVSKNRNGNKSTNSQSANDQQNSANQSAKDSSDEKSNVSD